MSETVERQYFTSYLAMINNSIDTQMYRNFYVRIDDGPVIDAINDGENACAFFVTSLLLVFGKQKSVHATVSSAVKDLEEMEWVSVEENELIPGDVVVWEGRDDTNNSQHIGFYVGENNAISTSSTQKKVVKHDVHFGDLKRRIVAAYRMKQW